MKSGRCQSTGKCFSFVSKYFMCKAKSCLMFMSSFFLLLIFVCRHLFFMASPLVSLTLSFCLCGIRCCSSFRCHEATLMKCATLVAADEAGCPEALQLNRSDISEATKDAQCDAAGNIKNISLLLPCKIFSLNPAYICYSFLNIIP